MSVSYNRIEGKSSSHSSGNAHLWPNGFFGHGRQHTSGRETVSTLNQSKNPALRYQLHLQHVHEPTYPAFRESHSGIDKLGKDILGGVNTGCSVDRKSDNSSKYTDCLALFVKLVSVFDLRSYNTD